MLKPPEESIKGLRGFCNRCKKDYTGRCKETGKVKCQFSEKWVYKLYLYNPTKNNYVTYSLTSRDAKEVVHEAMQAKERFRGNCSSIVRHESVPIQFS